MSTLALRRPSAEPTANLMLRGVETGLKHGLAMIDWHKAWLAPFAVTGERIANRVEKGATVPSALNAANMPLRAPIQFVPQAR